MRRVDRRHWQEHQTLAQRKDRPPRIFQVYPQAYPIPPSSTGRPPFGNFKMPSLPLTGKTTLVHEMTKRSSHLFHLNSRQFLFLLPRRHHSETSGLRMPALHTWAGTLLTHGSTGRPAHLFRALEPQEVSPPSQRRRHLSIYLP